MNVILDFSWFFAFCRDFEAGIGVGLGAFSSQHQCVFRDLESRFDGAGKSGVLCSGVCPSRLPAPQDGLVGTLCVTSYRFRKASGLSNNIKELCRRARAWL